MPRVVVTATATADLERLILTHSLPPGTKDRVARSLKPLARFPSVGARLGGRWEGLRFILGPWRWMVVIYAVDDAGEQVTVITIQDGRSAGAPRPG